LDVHTHKIEQYVGDYLDVVKEISARIERERMKNVRTQKDISNRKQQAGFFAQKGGHMRDVARKMREKIEELEEEVVETRQEDKTIPRFEIMAQDVVGPVVEIKSVSIVSGPKPMTKKFALTLRKKQRLLVSGPNGIGKSTFLEALAHNKAKGAEITPGVKVGYYRQDFSGLDFNMTCYECFRK
jgi:ATPase subunit of ABC transporter with duplicated ATPase domains